MESFQKRVNIFSFLILLCAAFTSFLFYISTPLGEDQRIFFASARQADYVGKFPYNVYKVWELKPLGNRLFIYSIYRATTFFVDFRDKASFELLVKIIYGLLIFGIVLLSLVSMRKFFKVYNLSPLLVFLVIIFSFYSFSYDIALQAEDISLLLFIVAMPLALAKSKIFNFLAGFPLATLITTKGITIFIVFYIFIIIYFLGRDYYPKLIWLTIGFVFSMFLVLATFITIFPQELIDLKNATLIQRSFYSMLDRFIYFAKHFWRYFIHIPILISGVIAAWITLPFFYWHKQWRDMLAFCILWGIGAFMIIAQRWGFSNYYAVLTIPAIFSIFLLQNKILKWIECLNKKRMICLTVWLIPLIGWLGVRLGLIIFLIWLIALVIFLSFIFLYSKKIEGFIFKNVVLSLVVIFSLSIWLGNVTLPIGLHKLYMKGSEIDQKYYRLIDEKYSLSREKEMLMLADGTFAYYFDAPIRCRYFFPLTIQRSTYNKDLLKTSAYKETIEYILKYNGEIILLHPNWFKLEFFPEIANKIALEYEQIFKSYIPSRPIVIFRKKHK